ncbi:YcaO-like family protein [Nonomuraea pusilla]|uniref:YcaO-like family protein n=1 Tax=Nonomuraea pusilla TaxID=46177 RepID=A0A1H8CCC4_9ACTN|nr:YcaO-like family protein [Nonomuraea pusilla]SEM92084.1 YcaO-like family protein [Nonomuraea pusilla]
MSAGESALLLRPDVCYGPSSDGLYLLTHRGSVAFRGPSAHRLLVRLAPYLDGRFTLAELTAELAPERRQAVERLVEALASRDVIRRVPRGEPVRSSPAVTMAGDERLVEAAAAMARRAGFRRIHVVPAARIESRESLLDSGPDFVLHVTDRPEHAMIADRVCAGIGVRVSQLVITGGQAWIGPVGRIGDGAPSWTDGWLRHLARHPAPDGGHASSRGAALKIAMGQWIHRVLRSADGALGDEEAAHLTRFDFATLRSEPQRVLPHPFTRADGGPGVLPEGPAVDSEQFARLVPRYMDPWTGLFGKPQERDHNQVPLRICEIEVSDPLRLLPRRPVAVGHGADFRTARLRAALKAFALYGALTIDPRRLLDAGGRPLSGVDDPWKGLAAVRSGETTAYVPGSRLDDGEPRLVPARQVFAVLGGDGPDSPGTAAGFTWREAVGSALLGRCLQVTLEDLASRPAPGLLDPAALPLDEHGARWRSALAAAGRAVTVHDITGPLDVPAAMCEEDGVITGRACGPAIESAVRDALEQALFHHQTRTRGQSPDAAALPSGREAPVADLIAALSRRGLIPVAVPLTHDQEARKVMPYVVHVVLAHD